MKVDFFDELVLYLHHSCVLRSGEHIRRQSTRSSTLCPQQVAHRGAMGDRSPELRLFVRRWLARKRSCHEVWRWVSPLRLLRGTLLPTCAQDPQHGFEVVLSAVSPEYVQHASAFAVGLGERQREAELFEVERPEQVRFHSELWSGGSAMENVTCDLGPSETSCELGLRRLTRQVSRSP